MWKSNVKFEVAADHKKPLQKLIAVIIKLDNLTLIRVDR